MRPAERVKIIEWIAAFASVALVGVLMVSRRYSDPAFTLCQRISDAREHRLARQPPSSCTSSRI
jgi:hypothetical protein